MPGVELQGLTKHFALSGSNQERLSAVDHVSLRVSKGSVLTLLGPSGCGKTTTLRCIAGLEVPDEGTITIDDKVVTSKEMFLPPDKRNLGMVFQSYAIWPHMTVFGNIAYPLKLRHVSKPKMREAVKRALSIVRMEGMEDRPSTQLSGGQQQRVALARALVYEPSVLLLDEPLSNLDAKLRENMRHELREIFQSLKLTTIYVTHDQIEALAISDTVGLMSHGKLLEFTSPTKLFENPSTRFVADFIGMTNTIEGRVSKAKEGVETQIGLVKCDIPEHFEDNAKVYVCIRPERVNVSRKIPEGKLNVFEGVVEWSTYSGSFVDLSVVVTGVKLRANSTLQYTIKKGETVFVFIDRDSCRILRE